VSITEGRIAFADRHSIGPVVDFDVGVGRARAEIYRTAPPANPLLRGGNRSCGRQAAAFAALFPAARRGGHRRGARRDRVLGAEPTDR
jgi:hypothetical protein